MKYLRLELLSDKIPVSINNFIEVIYKIGEINPENINRFSLLKNKNVNVNENFSKAIYFKRGILNIRKKLNTNLGLHGKYSNRMIKRLAHISSREIDSTLCSLKGIFPHAEYIKIVQTAYKMLCVFDKESADRLSVKHISEDYIGKATFGSCYNSVAPVQTSIILSTNCYNNESHDILKDKIRREKDNDA